MAKKQGEKMLHLMEGIQKIFTLKGIVALGLAGFAVTNLVTTFDLIPDTMPVVGGIDDVALILLAFWASKDLVGFVMEKLGWKK